MGSKRYFLWPSGHVLELAAGMPLLAGDLVRTRRFVPSRIKTDWLSADLFEQDEEITEEEARRLAPPLFTDEPDAR